MEVMLKAQATGMKRIHVRTQRKSILGCVHLGLSFLICDLRVIIVLPPSSCDEDSVGKGLAQTLPKCKLTISDDFYHLECDPTRSQLLGLHH